VGDRTLFAGVDWSIGPGERIGLVGVNGTGKTTLLRLLTGELAPSSGRVKRGRTLRIGHLTQALAAADQGADGEATGMLLPTRLDASEKVLESVDRLRRQTRLATGREASASSLLEEFGFTGERLVTRIGELSGGERRRLQFLRLLLGEPNVLLLDEPTNDLDIDTLTVIEDYLDTWPGTLIVVTHDRYFLERVCDVTYALPGDGRIGLLPGGIDEYLDHRRHALTVAATAAKPAARPATAATAAATRQARKDLARVEGQLAKTAQAIEHLHHELSRHATDYAKLTELGTELAEAEARHAALETQWLDLAETLESAS
jgi:ATPase subunit of ABC transporter with duplicated ATPase domains